MQNKVYLNVTAYFYPLITCYIIKGSMGFKWVQLFYLSLFYFVPRLGRTSDVGGGQKVNEKKGGPGGHDYVKRQKNWGKEDEAKLAEGIYIG